MPIRQSFSEPGLDTAWLFLVAVDRHLISEQGPSGPVSMCIGVTISSDLSLEKHVSTIRSTCFYWLRQILHIRRHLDTESTMTLVDAFIASLVDYCNTMLAGSPR